MTAAAALGGDGDLRTMRATFIRPRPAMCRSSHGLETTNRSQHVPGPHSALRLRRHGLTRERSRVFKLAVHRHKAGMGPIRGRGDLRSGDSARSKTYAQRGGSAGSETCAQRALQWAGPLDRLCHRKNSQNDRRHGCRPSTAMLFYSHGAVAQSVRAADS